MPRKSKKPKIPDIVGYLNKGTPAPPSPTKRDFWTRDTTKRPAFKKKRTVKKSK